MCRDGRSRTTALAALALATAAQTEAAAQGEEEPKPFGPAAVGQTDAPRPATPAAINIEIVATGLDQPSSFVFLPDERVLVAERAGSLRIVDPEAGAVSDPIVGVPEVLAVGDQGLNDVALAPDFAETGLIYFSYFAPPPGEQPGLDRSGERSTSLGTERVARARLAESEAKLVKPNVVLDGAEGRLAFAPDGTLYASTADRFWVYGFDHDGNHQEVTDFSTLATYTGRIVRITANGRTPSDNPWTEDDGVPDETFSYGHRNPEGAAIHPETGELWSVEQGPLGGDEVNIVRPGRNYGWPNYSYGHQFDGSPVGTGRQVRDGIEQPLYYWRSSIAPSGMTFYTGDLFPDWRGDLLIGATSEASGGFIVRLGLDGERVVEEERLLNGHTDGVSDVREASDGSVWVLSREGSLLRLTPGSLGVTLALGAPAVAEPVVAEDPVVIEAAVVDPAEPVVDPRPVSPEVEVEPEVEPASIVLVDADSAEAGPLLMPTDTEVVPLLPPPVTAVVNESDLPPVSAATTQQRTKTPRERYAQ